MEKECNDLLKLIKTSIKYSRISRFYDFYEYPTEGFLFKKLRTEVIFFAKKRHWRSESGLGKTYLIINQKSSL